MLKVVKGKKTNVKKKPKKRKKKHINLALQNDIRKIQRQLRKKFHYLQQPKTNKFQDKYKNVKKQ